MRDGLATACLARVNAPDPETYQADARFAFKPINEIVTADVLEILQPLWARVPETVEGSRSARKHSGGGQSEGSEDRRKPGPLEGASQNLLPQRKRLA